MIYNKYIAILLKNQQHADCAVMRYIDVNGKNKLFGSDQKLEKNKNNFLFLKNNNKK